MNEHLKDDQFELVMIEPNVGTSIESRLKKKVWRRLGYGLGSKPDRTIRKTLETVVTFAARTLTPKALFRLLQVQDIESGKVRTAVGNIFSSRFAGLVSLSRGRRYVLCEIVTIGDGLMQAFAGAPLHEQIVVDAVASELTEISADAAEAEFKRQRVSRFGLDMTMRFSPGYCDMGLEQQAVIFAALSGAIDRIGVSLNAGFIMSPSKSISGFAVVADRIPALAPCVFCKTTSCLYRRLEYDPLFGIDDPKDQRIDIGLEHMYPKPEFR